jgi:DNA sulfur modification protein DndB
MPNRKSRSSSPKINNNFADQNTFVFNALRGIQANKEYYIVMCPLRLIPKIFLFNEVGIPPEMRAQRTLNKSRIPEITSYLVKNEGDYVFSSITASIDGDVEFIPVEDNGVLSKLGTLKVPMNARFLINDGQHRRAAIENALIQRPELGIETISVVFYIDRGLAKSQQMFSDLNKHAVKPTTSLNILYDYRDQFSRTLINILKDIPIFDKGLTELEKTSISNRSNKVFTLNSIYNASKALLGKKNKKPDITMDEKALLISFWNQVYNNITEWQDVVKNKVSPFDLRKKYIHVYGIMIHALGLMGHELIKEYPADWKNQLELLNNIDWKRSNPKWVGRAMINGHLSKSRTNLILTTNFLKKKMSLPLSENEIQIEKNFGGDIHHN